MSDRELLELAAKAVGLRYFNWTKHGIVFTGGDVWNPLTDDGDAFRLAVILEMDVRIDNKRVVAYGNHVESPPIEIGRNAFTSVRRAIVRTAAEIGKRTQGRDPTERLMELADAYAEEAARNNEYDNRGRKRAARAALEKALKEWKRE